MKILSIELIGQVYHDSIHIHNALVKDVIDIKDTMTELVLSFNDDSTIIIGGYDEWMDLLSRNHYVLNTEIYQQTSQTDHVISVYLDDKKIEGCFMMINSTYSNETKEIRLIYNNTIKNGD